MAGRKVSAMSGAQRALGADSEDGPAGLVVRGCNARRSSCVEGAER